MIFNAMVEALVIFKIVFDLMLEIGMLLYRGAVALLRLIIVAIKQFINSRKTNIGSDGKSISAETNTEEL